MSAKEYYDTYRIMGLVAGVRHKLWEHLSDEERKGWEDCAKRADKKKS